MDKPQQGMISVIARAPFEVFYEGQAESLSAENKVGRFDILPGHADFFSMLEPCTVHIVTANDSVEFPISTGIVTVRDDEVMLFADM